MQGIIYNIPKTKLSPAPVRKGGAGGRAGIHEVGGMADRAYSVN